MYQSKEKQLIDQHAELFFIRQIRKSYAGHLYLFENRLTEIVRGRNWAQIKAFIEKEINEDRKQQPPKPSEPPLSI